MPVTYYGVLRYEGGAFAGWQAQPGRRTVQGAVAEALSQIANEPIAVQGASRTDAGVHALGQAVSFVWPHAPLDRLPHALNSMLAPEIAVAHLAPAPADFHARFDAAGKRYAYQLRLHRQHDPFAARYAWHVAHSVDLDRLRALLPRLVGTHDFAGFQSAGAQPRENTVRTLHGARLEAGALVGPQACDGLWRLEFEGDGFLYHMVRNLAGTLIEIARGRFAPHFLDDALTSGGPFLGHCAPPQGLLLVEVFYPAGRVPAHHAAH